MTISVGQNVVWQRLLCHHWSTQVVNTPFRKVCTNYEIFISVAMFELIWNVQMLKCACVRKKDAQWPCVNQRENHLWYVFVWRLLRYCNNWRLCVLVCCSIMFESMKTLYRNIVWLLLETYPSNGPLSFETKNNVCKLAKVYCYIVQLEGVLLVEFMYLVFTHMPGESYWRRLGSLLLYLCYIFWALINSITCGL